MQAENKSKPRKPINYTLSAYTCEHCGSTFHKPACRVGRYGGKYCDRTCSNKAKSHGKFTETSLKDVQLNVKTLGFTDMAKRLGVTAAALKTQMTQWRSEGHDIPYMRKANGIGAITRRKDGNVIYEYEKRAEGWVRIGRVSEYKERSKTGNLQGKNKEPKNTVTMRRVPKPEPIRLPDKVITIPQKSVRVDKRTVIMVNEDIPDSVAIERWYSKRAS